MSFLKRIFGDSVNEMPVKASLSNADKNEKVADDPVLFAEWVSEYIVLGVSFDMDWDHAPNEEQCQRLNISEKERRLCANEFVLLRALGACMFVRANLDEKYYLVFRKSLMPEVIERMDRNSPHMHHDNPSDALDQYLDDLKSESHIDFSMTYLDRVYPDTPSAGGILAQGIPVLVGLEEATLILKHTQDGYCKLKFGVDYETLQKLHNLSNET